MEFSRQDYWSGLPFPFPGDLPNTGIESGSPAFQTEALPPELPGKPLQYLDITKKIARRNINNLRYADDTTLMAESEEELKSLLIKVKEESWLKPQHSEN